MSAAKGPLQERQRSSRDFLQYLYSLAPNVLTALYHGEFAVHSCQALFRAVAPQARAYLLKALPGQDLPESAFSWKGSIAEHESALESLLKLKILNVTVDKAPKRAAVRMYKISETFSNGFREAIISQCVSKVGPGKGIVGNTERAEDYAAQQWNNIITFLVCCTDDVAAPGGGVVDPDEYVPQRSSKRARTSSPAPSSNAAFVKQKAPNLASAVQNALKNLGLFAVTENGGKSITSMGYEFLLKDVFDQVWIVIQHFISHLKQESQAIVLRFLLYASFLNPGTSIHISPEQLTPECTAFFSACGLIMPLSTGENRFTLSSLCVHAIFPPSSQRKLIARATQQGDDEDQQFINRQIGMSGMRIIVETTFKVFCYTTSAMHAQMLQLFCVIETRLPNLVVANINRASVMEAYKKGISDEQLISFLQSNAHPVTQANRRKIVPDNVTDQLRLWKRELERVTYTFGRFFNLEKEPVIFGKLMANSELEKYIPWRNDEQRKFFLTNEGISVFRQVLDQVRQQIAATGQRI